MNHQKRQLNVWQISSNAYDKVGWRGAAKDFVKLTWRDSAERKARRKSQKAARKRNR